MYHYHHAGTHVFRFHENAHGEWEAEMADASPAPEDEDDAAAVEWTPCTVHDLCLELMNLAGIEY